MMIPPGLMATPFADHDTGLLLPTVAANIGSGGLWNNPTRITAIDASYATGGIQGTPHNETRMLAASGFGLSIPDHAELLGFEVRALAFTGTTPAQLVAWLAEDVTNVSSNQTDNSNNTLATSDTVEIWGGPTDLWIWPSGLPTPADLNDPNFGVWLTGIPSDSSTPATFVAIDYVQFKVYWRG